MKSTLLASAAALLCLVAPFSSPVLAALYGVEAAFDAGRFADDLSGSYSGAPDTVIRVSVHASAGSWISANLAPDPTTAAPIPGLTLTLLDPAGVDQNVTGSKYDKTKPDATTIVWNKVPLATTGDYAFLLGGTGAGTWRLKLKGALKSIVHSFPSPADLAVGAETQVEFEGLRGGTVSYNLAPTGTSKFRGELVRVERPDGTPIDGTPITNKGKVLLDIDGLHRLVFKNVGPGIGPWIAKITAGASPIFVRRGYVRPSDTALVPIVGKVTPPNDYHLDDELSMTITGRDFQPGADVRLVRNGFADIVATDVEVNSETTIRCRLNLATAPVTGVFSTGKWRVGVWNAPVYLTPGDPTTLDRESPTHDTKKSFSCLAASAITLPAGAIKDTETWHLVFNSDFQTDLNNMGLGSNDAQTAKLARGAVQAYVVCFLRDLFRANETTGKLTAGVSPQISFVVGKIPSPAGKAGRDYNRVEIGGAWQDGDPDDPAEPLPWGFAPLNQHPVDLSVNLDDGQGGTVRAGFGVRTDVLSIYSPTINTDWANALSPLNQKPLTILDRGYFAPRFNPASIAQANRYRDIVNQTTRVSREIAAIIAHHIGRSMGLTPGGSGPMANPATSGYLWPTTTGLSFTESDAALLRANALPVTLPGKSKGLIVTYFPLLATQPSNLPDSTANVDYSVNWNFVGGRANAVPADYSVRLLSGLPILSYLPLQGAVVANFQGLTITNSPLYYDAVTGLPYGGIAYLRLTTTDVVRGGVAVLFYRLNVHPNFSKLPTSGVVYQRAISLEQYIVNN